MVLYEEILNKQKSLHYAGFFVGGEERTRTAVEGFADLCLTTRPLRLYRNVKVRKRYSQTKALQGLFSLWYIY